MTTEVIYICDVCGKQFDDEDECQKHETAHTYEDVTAKDCRIFDFNGREMSWEDDPDDCYYYEVNTERGIDAVDAFLNKDNCWHTVNVQDGRFMWYDEEWIDANFFRQKAEEVDKIFGA